MASYETLAVCFLLLFHYVQSQHPYSCDGDADSFYSLDPIRDPLTVKHKGSIYYFTLCSNIANVSGCINSSVCVTNNGTTISYGEPKHEEVNTSTNIITLTFSMAERIASVKLICDDNLDTPHLTVDITTKPNDLHLNVSGDIFCNYGQDFELENTPLPSSTAMSSMMSTSNTSSPSLTAMSSMMSTSNTSSPSSTAMSSMMSTSKTLLSTLLPTTGSSINTATTQSPRPSATSPSTSTTQSPQPSAMSPSTTQSGATSHNTTTPSRFSTVSSTMSITLLSHSGSTSLNTSTTPPHLGSVSLLISTTPLPHFSAISSTFSINSSSSISSAPTQPSSSGTLSCTSKILITAFVGIPSAAVIVIITMILILVCCKRKKRGGGTYVRLAPTVFFDDDDS